MRAIQMYMDLFAGAVIDGLQKELAASGADVGAAAEPPAADAAKDAGKAADDDAKADGTNAAAPEPEVPPAQAAAG